MIKPLKFEGGDNWKTAYALGYVYSVYGDSSGYEWIARKTDGNTIYSENAKSLDAAIAACNEHWRNIVFSLLDNEKGMFIKRFPWTCGTCGKDIEGGTITKNRVDVKCDNCGSEWVS